MAKIMMVGTAENSGGGITSVIRLIKKMPLWKRHRFYWLGTQKQDRIRVKLMYAIKAALKAPFIMHRYDIIHFHIVPGITLLIQLPELIMAKLFQKKIILEVHVGNQLVPYAGNRFFKWWLGRADLVLLLAEKWKELFEDKYRDVSRPAEVLYNACEMVPPVPPERKKHTILFAGTIDDNKAPDILIKAWSSLKSDYPDWKILFVGNGQIDKFRHIAEEFGVDDSVEFKGYIEGKNKKRIFEEASIYCMCSYAEGFPMVVLEAWANCIPVVTTPVGGLPDVIVDGKNCLIFQFGDSDALAAQLKKLLDSADLRETIGREGYQTAQEIFSLDRVSEKLEKIYNKLLNSSEK